MAQEGTDVWARRKHLAKERKSMRRRDPAEPRARELPWELVEYRFEGERGAQTLSECRWSQPAGGLPRDVQPL